MGSFAFYRLALKKTAEYTKMPIKKSPIDGYF